VVPRSEHPVAAWVGSGPAEVWRGPFAREAPEGEGGGAERSEGQEAEWEGSEGAAGGEAVFGTGGEATTAAVEKTRVRECLRRTGGWKAGPPRARRRCR
jgi:hypothetical protein